VVEAKARAGTDFFTVVDSVGLQVVANIAHDEKRGNCAQLLAPSVLLLKVPAQQMVGEAGAKVRGQEEIAKNEQLSHGQILSIQAPIQPLTARVTMGSLNKNTSLRGGLRCAKPASAAV
jgi:hypothetical protein